MILTGKLYPEGWARFSALVIFVGFNLTFFPQFIVGYMGMPRRYHFYPEEFQILNVLSSAGATILGLAYLIPVIYLVDCSGLFLPEQSRTFSGKTGAGHIFTMNSLLSAAGVPQIAGVHGDCIAGGGYMPIISDIVYMTEQAYMVIAGAALPPPGRTPRPSVSRSSVVRSSLTEWTPVNAMATPLSLAASITSHRSMSS